MNKYDQSNDLIWIWICINQNVTIVERANRFWNEWIWLQHLNMRTRFKELRSWTENPNAIRKNILNIKRERIRSWAQERQ